MLHDCEYIWSYHPKLSSGLFLCPAAAWNVEEEPISLEIGKFNGLMKLFHTDLVFTDPPTIAQLQSLFAFLVSRLSSGSGSNVSVAKIVESLTRVLLKVEQKSQLFAFALVTLRQLTLKYPTHGFLKTSFAACLIRSSNLPITFARHHLMHISEEDAGMIIDFLDNPNFSDYLKCLVVSVVLPSARLTDLEVYGCARHIILPDPLVIISNHECFDDDEFLYASAVIQQAHALVRKIGEGNSSLPLARFIVMQDFVTRDYLSPACLCRSLTVHARHPSTLRYSIGFWNALDSECGVEIIRELILTNASPSYATMMKSLGHHVVMVLEKHRKSFSPNFINVYSVMGGSLTDALGTISNLLDATGEAHISWAYSLLLRISLESISDVAVLILEHFHGILRHFAKIIEYGVINVQMKSVLLNKMVVNTLSLFYKLFNRFKITTISNQFARDTISVLNWIVFVPIVDGSYMAFDLLDLYEAIEETIRSHDSRFRESIEKTISWSDAIGSAIAGTIAGVSEQVFYRLFSILIDSSLPTVFEILQNLCFSVLQQSGIPAVFNDVFFDGYISHDDNELRTHRFEVFCVLLTAVCEKSSTFCSAFMQTSAFYKICDVALEFFRSGKLKDSLRLVDIFLQLFDQFCSQGDLQLPEFDLTPLFAAVRSLSGRAVDALLRLSLQLIAKCQHAKIPYGINLSMIAATPCNPALFKTFTDELKRRFECPETPDPVPMPVPGGDRPVHTFPWKMTAVRTIPGTNLRVTLAPQVLSPTQVITVEVD